MVHYKLVKIIINALELAKIILNMVVQYHGLHNLMVSNKGL